MDVFIEKIVQKRKGAKDYLIIIGVIIATIILMLLVMAFIPGMSLFFWQLSVISHTLLLRQGILNTNMRLQTVIWILTK